MSSIVQLFSFGDNEVRVLVGADGEPWWIAKDICAVLEIKDASHAVESLDEDEKRSLTYEEVRSNSTNPDTTRLLAINEPGLYQLVFRSRKPQAKEFRRWLSHEVIPSIRKTGLFNASMFTLSSDSTLVSFERGDYWVHSSSVAEIFGKEHYHVLRDIEAAKKDVSKFGGISNKVQFKWEETIHIDKYGRSQRCLKINRPMFDFVVLAYQGEKAKEYRMMFISAFHEMEKQLKLMLTQQLVYSNPKRQQLYILSNTLTGKIKIGITNDIKRRVAELENASGCPIKVEYLSPKCDNAHEIEKELHNKFKGFRSIGEWFDVNPSEVEIQAKAYKLLMEPKLGNYPDAKLPENTLSIAKLKQR